MQKLLAWVCLLAFPFFAYAQSPTDGLMMPKGNLCHLVQYTHSSWDHYWEGDLNRVNVNLGTVSTQQVMLMGALGITDRLNVMYAAPYIWTDASASYLDGQHGIQDLSVWLKYTLLDKKMGPGKFKIYATGGGSAPLSNYTPDFMPFSIGMHSKNASLRGILYYELNNGFYILAQAGHSWRSNVSIDREAYLYGDELIYSNDVPVPNTFDGTAKIGYLSKKFQADLFIDRFTCLSGDDIRYNDAPFLTNNMQATSAGFFAKYYFDPFAVQISAGKVLQGRNMGEGLSFSAGFTYFFQAFGGK